MITFYIFYVFILYILISTYNYNIIKIIYKKKDRLASKSEPARAKPAQATHLSSRTKTSKEKKIWPALGPAWPMDPGSVLHHYKHRLSEKHTFLLVRKRKERKRKIYKEGIVGATKKLATKIGQKTQSWFVKVLENCMFNPKRKIIML